MKEDLFEAIIGAVALDSDWDMEELQEVIQIMLDPDSYLKDDTKDNYVELIQEWTLKRYGGGFRGIILKKLHRQYGTYLLTASHPPYCLYIFCQLKNRKFSDNPPAE